MIKKFDNQLGHIRNMIGEYFSELYGSETPYAAEIVRNHNPWHSYPDEKPDEDGYYLVYIRYERDGIREHWQDKAFYDAERDFWQEGWNRTVLNWMELPKNPTEYEQ